MMFKKILEPFDGSGFSSHALLFAREIVDNFNSELILLRVVESTGPIAEQAVHPVRVNLLKLRKSRWKLPSKRKNETQHRWRGIYKEKPGPADAIM